MSHKFNKSRKCVFKECNSGPNRSYHTFPNDFELRAKWISACELTPSQIKKDIRVCNLHFSNESYKTHSNRFHLPLARKKLKKDAIPMPVSSLQQRSGIMFDIIYDI